MKVVYYEDYNEVYSSDPAAAAGRIQAVEIALRGNCLLIIVSAEDGGAGYKDIKI